MSRPGLYWYADPARHDYRAADADRPEDGCASCGHLAEGHPNARPAAPAAEAGDELRAALALESSRHGAAIGVKQDVVLCTCGWRDESYDNFKWPLGHWSRHVADAVLALPALQRLVEQAAEAARLRAVVARVRSMRDVATANTVTTAALDWALDGDL